MFIKGRAQNACASSCLLLMVLALPAAADAQEAVTPLASESPRIDLATVPAVSNTLVAVETPAQIATGAKRGFLCLHHKRWNHRPVHATLSNEHQRLRACIEAVLGNIFANAVGDDSRQKPGPLGDPSC